METCSKPSACPPAIQVSAGADGVLIYRVDQPPEAMPCVRVRDLARAWDGARHAAQAREWGVKRGLRFHLGDGLYTHLALADRDATCWAGAIDQMAGLHNSYGLSLCLRLLALIDLLARAGWAAPLLTLHPGGARLHPCLLRLAANATLTQDARFDEERFHAGLVNHLSPRIGTAPIHPDVEGACA